MEEQHPVEDKKNDSKYRRYVAALEKCLQSFESVNEWADVISFLSRLGKVFNSFPTFKEIPFKLNLAKRLAQCLNPALPAGVHQKTLEVYEMVFRKIGNENLVKDLSLYSFGLFPFFEHSATLVKNSLLELYEVYLIPLGSGLTPSLRPLVLSIILGLEEESSDYFTKVNNLLNRIKVAVGTTEFYDAIWTGLLISPHHRLAIINFLLKNIPPNASSQELMEICVNNTKLVSSALSAALQDQEQLVVRGSLEVLLKHFAVEKRFFEMQQLIDLFQASMNVLTRKDMSLTRRFYTWILTSGPSEIESLSDYNLSVLTFALKNLISNQCKSPEEFSKPFKLLIFILDKPVVSNPLLKECLFPLVNLTIEASKALSEEDFSKVLHSANLLFRMLELDTIWGSFLRKINETDSGCIDDVKKVVEVIDFAVRNLFICDDTSPMVQVHLLIYSVLRKIFGNQNSQIHPAVIDSLLDLCIKLVNRLSLPSEHVLKSIEEDAVEMLCLKLSENVLSESSDETRSDSQIVPKLMVLNAKLLVNNKDNLICFSDEISLRIGVFVKSNHLLNSFIINMANTDNDINVLEYNSWLGKILFELENTTNIDVINACLMQIDDMSRIRVEKSEQVRATLIIKTLPFLWEMFCSEADGKDRISFLISTLCRILPNESDIYFAQVLSTSIRNSKFHVVESFTEFWDVSTTSHLLIGISLRISVLVLVDSMTKREFKFRQCSVSWIFAISKYLDRFLIPSISSFIDILECGLTDSYNSASALKKSFRKKFDKGPLIYYLNIIERLLEVNYEDILNYLTVTEVDSYLMIQMAAFIDMIKNHLGIDFEFDYKNNYLNLLMMLCLPLITMEEHKSLKAGSSLVRVAALNMLGVLLKAANFSSLPMVRILLDFSIFKLNFFVCNSFDAEKQSHFLKFFEVILSNNSIASLLSAQDIIYLAETVKAALKMAENPGTVHNWSEFAITLGLLPNTNIELVMSILTESLISRLQNSLNSEHGLSPSILSSIFISIAKLSIFYLASKSNIFADKQHLRNSVSCLLNEVKTEATTNLSTVKLSTASNLDDFERIVSGLFSAHQFILSHEKASSADDSKVWSQCVSVLRDSCNVLYSTNRSLITEVLISVFIKTRVSESNTDSHLFLSMFYNQEASEFIRSIVYFFKSSKDGWKNQDIFLKLMLEFSKNEDSENVLLEIWSVTIGQIKELSSSGFKFKAVMWLLIENVCHLMERIDAFDPSRIIKDFVSEDWVMKLIENSVIYAAKLNESSQWLNRPEEVVDIRSESFKTIMLDNVKDKNLGKCVISICQVLLPNLKYFRDSDKLNAVLTPIISNLITPNFKSPLRYSLMGQISSYCLGRTLQLNKSSNKYWKRELWEAFSDNAFLWMPRYYFGVLTDAFQILTQEPDRFIEVLSKFSTSATASMFLSKDAEILTKALNIRRLSFMTFWGNFDVFRNHLPSLQEKLVEMTKYYNGFLLGEIFFLIRVFLLRLNDESISSLWPLIMTELVQLFENSIKSDQINSADMYALFQACKLIDMMLTLRTSSILLYHWLFFDSAGKEGLFLRLEQKIRKGPSTSQFSSPVSTNFSKRRPLLSPSSIKDTEELLDFLEAARSHLSHDFIMIQNLDMDFINCMTEKDLLEVLEIK